MRGFMVSIVLLPIPVVPAASLAGSAIAVTAVAPAAAIDIYGRLNVTLQNSDEAAEEQVELQSNASRVGVRGEEALNGALKVIYQLEWGVNLDSESSNENLFAHNQFVGLEGGLGTGLESLLSAGLDHKLGMATKLFAFYTSERYRGNPREQQLHRDRHRAQFLIVPSRTS